MRADKPYPSSIEGETVFVSSMYHYPKQLLNYASIVAPQDFHNKIPSVIYSILLDMKSNEMEIREDSFRAQLSISDLKGLDQIDILDFLEESDRTPFVEQHAKKVIEYAARRKTILTSEMLSRKAYDETVSIDEIVSSAADFYSDIEERTSNDDSCRSKAGRVIRVTDIDARLNEHYENGLQLQGVSTSFQRFSELLRIAKRIMTVITGIPSHGKSEFFDALAMILAMMHGWKFGIFSPENFPSEYHIQKLAEKYIGKPLYGKNRMTWDEYEKAKAFINDHFNFFELDEDRNDLDALLRLIKKEIDTNGLDAFVIDPWNELTMSLNRGETETDYIGRSLSKIRRFARKNNVSAFIIAHPKKMFKDESGRYPIPEAYDINGSAHWYNKADNIIAVYRDDKLAVVNIHIQKVKFKMHGGKGVVSMKYDKVTGRYSEFEAGWNDD